MATLDAPAQMPPVLQLEQPPTVNNLIAQIDDWIIYHLLRTLESDIHYENQLYGPISSFLTSIFPSRRRYMFIPQAIFRRAMSDSEVAEDLANVSIGSTGAFHESRDFAGVEHFKQFPDFVTVKVTPQPGIDRDHHIVCVVEVKRNNDTEAKAVEQMEAYMEQAANLPKREESLRGYLVMGNMVRTFWLQDDGEGVEVKIAEQAFAMSAPGDQFTRELCEISIRNWNYQS